MFSTTFKDVKHLHTTFSLAQLHTEFYDVVPEGHYVSLQYGRQRTAPLRQVVAGTISINLDMGSVELDFPETNNRFNRWWIDIPDGETVRIADRVLDPPIEDTSWTAVGTRLVSPVYGAGTVYRAIVSLNPFS